jgi:hypothetical protein
MRAAHLLIIIDLDKRTKSSIGELMKALENRKYRFKQLWTVFSCPRINGYFHTDKIKIHRKIGAEPPPKPLRPLIKAIHPGNGVGVFVAFKPSQLDMDMGFDLWAPVYWMVELIEKTIQWSQKATHDMLGRPFGGEMPYAELADFM